MKKLFFITLLSAMSISVFSQSSKDGKIRLGIGGAYASEIDAGGFSIKAIYEITEKWEAALTYSYFPENLGTTWNVLDIDGHFVFYDNDKKVNIYALSGLGATFWSRQTIGTILRPSETVTGSYIGWNIGIGANFALSDRINLAPEIRGTLSEVAYTRIGLTLQYMF